MEINRIKMEIRINYQHLKLKEGLDKLKLKYQNAIIIFKDLIMEVIKKIGTIEVIVRVMVQNFNKEI